MRFKGNKIVENFDDGPNSIIIGKGALSEDDKAAIDDYIRYNDEVEVELIENLI
jgi:hypothetical protein